MGKEDDNRCFTAADQQRLVELLGKWREAQRAGCPLAPAERAELETLIDAELDDATRHAAIRVGERIPPSPSGRGLG